MDPNRNITKKFDTDVSNRQYFLRKTGLKTTYLLFSNGTFKSFSPGWSAGRSRMYGAFCPIKTAHKLYAK